jgi:PKD repeat protein
MTEQVSEKGKEKSWIKYLGFLASAGVLAAVVSFVLPKLWPENKPPTSKITINNTKGNAPLRILADGFQSSDPEGKKLNFQWELNKNPISTEGSFEKIIEAPGLYTIVLTVTDPDEMHAMSSVIVEVLEPINRETPILMLDVFSEKNARSPNSLQYKLKRENNKISIKPVDKYLTAVYAGKLLKPLHFTYSPWERNFVFPSLDMKLVNNTSETLFLHEAVFQVERSWLDQRPIPIIKGTGYFMRLPLRNIGWGSMHNTVLNFSLVNPEEYTDEIPEQPYTLNAGTIDTIMEDNSLAYYFEKAGVNKSLLSKLQGKTGFSCGGDGCWVYFPKDSTLGQPYEGSEIWHKGSRRMLESEYRSLLKEAYGPFITGAALVVGEIEYGSIEKSGEMLTKVNKFNAKVVIGEPGVGIPMPPSHQYNAKLKVSGSDYEVRIPISHVIEPGKADRFLIQVAAEKSSFHEFNVALIFNNSGEILTDPISLDLFVSRNDANLMERKENREITRITEP